MDMGHRADTSACPFCRRGELEIVLAATDHFYVVVDNAPLTEGHLLIVPHEHLTCYGAVPSAYDDELLALKARVADFLEQTYRSVCFFEHGVFRQTVYHAHLHAIPLGATTFTAAIPGVSGDTGGIIVRQQADVRTWYAATGPYFYVEQATSDRSGSVATLYPADESVYFHVLAALVSGSGRHQPYQSQAARRLSAGPRMRAVAEAWARYNQSS